MTNCIETKAGRNGDGYGVVRDKGKLVLAHRQAYEREHGPIPAGLLVRHTCDNPPCINPEHLILGSHGDNLQDSYDRGRLAWNTGQHKTECKFGHVFDEANTRISKRGHFECRACGRAKQAKLREQRKRAA